MAKLSIDPKIRAADADRVMPPAGNGIYDELELFLLEVGILANHLKKTARRIHSNDQLPAGARNLLQSLAHHGSQTVPQLARARSTSRQNIQVLMNRLDSMGHVEFLANPAHKRSDLIHLTEQGRTRLSTATQREANFLAPLLSHVSEEEILAATALLSRVRQLLAGHAQVEPRSAVKKKQKPTQRNRKQTAALAREIVAATIHPALEQTSPSTAEDVELPVSLL
jgi:DNA-binding MarR family transcriptional regulator